jgi:prepilin-type N-terminal cleavage/methylation domain
MYQKLKGNRKGFTLAELLIVIAIIAILAAIAIPVYSTQMTKARVRVNQANIRSAQGLAVADYMLEQRSGGATYSATVANGNMTGPSYVNDSTTTGQTGDPAGTEIFGTITIYINSSGQYSGYAVS